MKIYVLGGVCSGKTWLTELISKKLKIPHYNLDDLYFTKKYDEKRSSVKRAQLIKKIAAKKNWVAEGVYSSWTMPLLQSADSVVIINPPTSIRIYRFFVREFKKKSFFKHKKFLEFVNFTKSAFKYNKKSQNKGFHHHVSVLKENQIKFKVLKTKKQIQDFVKSLK